MGALTRHGAGLFVRVAGGGVCDRQRAAVEVAGGSNDAGVGHAPKPEWAIDRYLVVAEVDGGGGDSDQRGARDLGKAVVAEVGGDRGDCNGHRHPGERPAFERCGACAAVTIAAEAAAVAPVEAAEFLLQQLEVAVTEVNPPDRVETIEHLDRQGVVWESGPGCVEQAGHARANECPRPDPGVPEHDVGESKAGADGGRALET